MWGRFGSKIEHPARDKSAQDWYVGNDDCNVIFNVIHAVIDWVCPVGMEEAVETIAVRQVDLRRANGCDTVVMLITDHISKHPRNLRKTGGKHGQNY